MSNTRGKIYVDRQVQGALAKRIVLHWLAFLTLCIACLAAFEYFTGEPHLSFGEHAFAVWNKYAFFLLLMLAVVPSFIWDTMKLSNRFTGPVLRLRDGIRRLADGEDVPEMKFRDNDFWRELSSDFNRAAARVSEPKA